MGVSNPDTFVYNVDEHPAWCLGTMLELDWWDDSPPVTVLVSSFHTYGAEALDEQGEVWKIPYDAEWVKAVGGRRPRWTLQEGQDYAYTLLEQYNLPEWWCGFFVNNSSILGCCNYRHKTISMSMAFALTSSKAGIEDCVRHEVAHALVGPGKGHGREWRQKAVELGAVPESKGKAPHMPRYYVHCPVAGCRSHAYRNRKQTKTRRYYCRLHGFDLEWKRNTHILNLE